MKTRRIAPLLALALLVASCSSSDDKDSSSTTPDAKTTTSAGTKAPTAPGCDNTIESPDPTLMVDRCGRVVILRGINVEGSNKGDAMTASHFPKTSKDLQKNISGIWGWNTVRFLVFWGAIEPEKGTYDEEYLDKVAEWMDFYEEQGLNVVLDMHQDLYSWKAGFDGAPDWAVDTQGHPIEPPSDSGPWWMKGADPAVQASFQSFWNPKDGNTELQDHYVASLAHLAERFKDHPAVIGYDVMNEPAFANGDLAATLEIQADAAAGNFHNTNLTDFMNTSIAAIRKVSPNQYVFIEPTSLINYFPYAGDLIEEDIVDPREGAPRIVYAGHLYEPEVHEGTGYPETSTYVDEWFDLRTGEAKTMKASLWFGEWGGASDQARMGEFIDDVTAGADKAMAGWALWSWDPGGWSSINADGTPTANGEALLRVQPRAIAGTPTAFAWDPATKTFTMSWDERSEVKADTEIAVPASLFADGVQVVLDGDAVATPDWDQATSTLTVTPDRSAATHTVCVAPKGSTCS